MHQKILFLYLWSQMCLLPIAILSCVFVLSCSDDSSDSPDPYVPVTEIVVDSLEDSRTPAEGSITLRSALASIPSGGKITFHSSLNGGTINLHIIGEAHSILKAEVFVNNQFKGYQERDYGKSSLYAKKNITIDATSLPDGITLAWDGARGDHARVLAVYGNLTLRNIAISSGYALYEALESETQPFTLGRGGGLAVWGTATLENCTISGNKAEGDPNSSRDRGSFGGGIYGDLLLISNCIISGNSAKGYGAAGGGVYSVSGVEFVTGSTLSRCTIAGNSVTAQHAYGGGVYSDGGGPGNMNVILLENCTIARNKVVDNPDIDEPPGSQYYYRGGGFYMSNGSVRVISCTIAQNAVTGKSAVFNNKPNIGGGGMAATIGNAHVVEDMNVSHSILVGNTVNDAANDIYTGSLIHFYSKGYNLIGNIDPTFRSF